VINRKAGGYSNPELVGSLYSQYREGRHDLDMARHKRTQHNELAAQIVTMEDDVKRERKLAEHRKVAKCMKRGI